MKAKLLALAFICALALILYPVSRLLAQGSLTPPGAPAPTMKSLDQIEPRIPISQPGSFPILINQPGSYYLTSSIAGVADTDGIRINVSGVTIDLNGFEVSGAGTVGDGIRALVPISNATIRNGVVRSWGKLGLNLQNVTNCRVENVTVSGCGDLGLHAGVNGVIKDCIFSGNTFGGLIADSGSAATHCSANVNIGWGFNLGAGSAITSCAAHANSSFGIGVGAGSTVSACSVYDNVRDGITTKQGCVIQNNSTLNNTGDNIEVNSNCTVMNNTCDGAGIHVLSFRNRIDGNNVTFGVRGIQVDAANNTILNNTVSSNPLTGPSANYVIATGNQVNILLTYLPETIANPATVTLSGDLTGVNGSSGLTISADNVTVDLAGHALVGVAGSLDGIAVSGSRANLTIKNGTARNWGGDGVDAATSANGQFDRLQLSNNGGSGMNVGIRALVTDCTAKQNGSHGISGGNIATVSRCQASLNTGIGISMSETARIEGCNLNNNTGGGIAVSSYSVVRDNVCDLHGAAAGIRVTGSDNRIEGNNVTRNSRGIDIAAAGNLIIKNSASDNAGAGAPSGNYSFNGFTQTNGTIVTATGTISADPWANFSY